MPNLTMLGTYLYLRIANLCFRLALPRGNLPVGSPTRFAKPLLDAVARQAGADAGRLVALAADEHHVGKLNRHLLREPAALRVSLAAANVLINAIDPLDDDLAFVAIDSQYLAALALVVAGDHFHRVVHANPHHTTS